MSREKFEKALLPKIQVLLNISAFKIKSPANIYYLLGAKQEIIQQRDENEFYRSRYCDTMQKVFNFPSLCSGPISIRHNFALSKKQSGLYSLEKAISAPTCFIEQSALIGFFPVFLLPIPHDYSLPPPSSLGFKQRASLSCTVEFSSRDFSPVYLCENFSNNPFGRINLTGFEKL